MWFVGIEDLFDNGYELFCCFCFEDFVGGFVNNFFFLYFLVVKCCGIYISEYLCFYVVIFCFY